MKKILLMLLVATLVCSVKAQNNTAYSLKLASVAKGCSGNTNWKNITIDYGYAKPWTLINLDRNFSPCQAIDLAKLILQNPSQYPLRKDILNIIACSEGQVMIFDKNIVPKLEENHPSLKAWKSWFYYGDWIAVCYIGEHKFVLGSRVFFIHTSTSDIEH